MMNNILTRWKTPLLWGLGYFALARLSLFFVARPENIAVFWLPNGLLLAGFIRSGKPDGMRIMGASFAASMIANLWSGNPVLISIGFSAVNMSEAFLAAWAIARWAGGTAMMERLDWLLGFILSVLFASAAGGLGGAAVVKAGFNGPFWSTAGLWWSADTVGLMIVTPMVVACKKCLQTLNTLWRRAEIAMWVGATCAVALFIFFKAMGAGPLPFILFPILVGAAIRFGAVGAGLVTAPMVVIACSATIQGMGPFQLMGRSVAGHIMSLQMFLGSALVSCYTLAAALNERRNAEKDIYVKTRILESVMMGMNEGMLVVDREGRLLHANSAAAKMLGLNALDVRLEQWMSKCSFFLPDEKTPYPPDRFPTALIARGESCRDVDLFVRNNPTPSGMHLTMDGTPLIDENGALYGGVVVFRDVTAQKEVAQKKEEHTRSLETANRQKEVLIKEVHHRVKNNMQIISSLLRLQSKFIQNKDDLVLFRESEDRVKSMALIHEKLYRSKDLAQVEFADYLQSLTSELAYAYRTGKAAVDVRVAVNAPSLALDDAIPLGLIVNELVSNAFKHAFKNERPGTMSIDLSVKNGDATLTVVDDGAGLPANFDQLKKDSLGLQLVDTLSRQLGGEAKFTSGQGSRFELTFPLAR